MRTPERREPGWVSLAGFVIRQAISDYKGTSYFPSNRGAARQKAKQDAQEFLFSERLDDFMKRFSIDELITPDEIRRAA